MNPLLLTGTIVVFFALAAYTIGIVNGQWNKQVNRVLLGFLSLGVCLDILATTLMILGSEKGGFSLHGFIGYSALTGMLLDTLLMWRLKIQQGNQAPVPLWLHKYSRYAYLWWVLAFITGGLLVALP